MFDKNVTFLIAGSCSSFTVRFPGVGRREGAELEQIQLKFLIDNNLDRRFSPGTSGLLEVTHSSSSKGVVVQVLKGYLFRDISAIRRLDVGDKQ